MTGERRSPDVIHNSPNLSSTRPQMTLTTPTSRRYLSRNRSARNDPLRHLARPLQSITTRSPSGKVGLIFHGPTVVFRSGRTESSELIHRIASRDACRVSLNFATSETERKRQFHPIIQSPSAVPG